MKKRIKTRRLTNIYHSDDDDVGDSYNLLSLPVCLSVSLCPCPSSLDSCQQSECAKIFEHGFWIAFAIGYSQKQISLTLLLL